MGWYDTFWSYLLGLFSGSATGRLLAYYPQNGSTHVLAKGKNKNDNKTL